MRTAARYFPQRDTLGASSAYRPTAFLAPRYADTHPRIPIRGISRTQRPAQCVPICQPRRNHTSPVPIRRRYLRFRTQPLVYASQSIGAICITRCSVPIRRRQLPARTQRPNFPSQPIGPNCGSGRNVPPCRFQLPARTQLPYFPSHSAGTTNQTRRKPPAMCPVPQVPSAEQVAQQPARRFYGSTGSTPTSAVCTIFSSPPSVVISSDASPLMPRAMPYSVSPLA